MRTKTKTMSLADRLRSFSPSIFRLIDNQVRPVWRLEDTTPFSGYIPVIHCQNQGGRKVKSRLTVMTLLLALVVAGDHEITTKRDTHLGILTIRKETKSS